MLYTLKDIHTDYKGMTLIDASQEVIRRASKALSPEEIMFALEIGGYVFEEDTSLPAPETQYEGLTLLQAITLFMLQQARPCSTREITEGLKQGGFQTTCKNFPKEISTFLGKKKRLFFRNDEGLWDMREDELLLSALEGQPSEEKNDNFIEEKEV